jgi:hypothetical protein
VTRLLLLSALAIAALPVAATARTVAAPGLAREMESSARQSLLARCGADPRCAAFGRQEGVEPAIRIAGVTCSESKRQRVRFRRCAFTAQSAARSDRLSCSAEFHQGPGSSATLWSDRKLVKQVRVYLPTSRIDAPMTLGPSTLSCSGSPIDYVS